MTKPYELEVETLTLRAVRRGFVGGAMVERGQVFTWTGTRRGRPSWAIDSSLPLPPEPEVRADTKPLAAQAAAKRYASANRAGIDE